MGLCSVPFRMPAVVFPSPGSSFHCDSITGCFVPVNSPHRHQTSDYSLPKDPRFWSRDDVACWLRHISSDHGLPTIPLDRFQMNGKALCLMNVDMFVQRVPLGGKLLYKDFQLRLCAAMYAR
uniref:PNT domain-containing protein n=1 Tax=Strigamia maritima TaxID=126957 RepID=T1J9H1_STRMM